MRAIVIREAGGPEVLTAMDVPHPVLKNGEVMIRVAASGVNRPDVLQRMGLYPAPAGASNIPGLEVSGEVVERGESVSRWKIGDRVCALTAGGGYAEFVAVHEGSCLPIPEHLSVIEAACVPETFMTVWHNVFERGELKSGESFLVHGGSSGIGTAAIQLAVRFGARVFATAGSDEKCAFCESLGAERAINYKTKSFAAEVKELTARRGVDVILDMVGGSYIKDNISICAEDGRIVQIAFLQGSRTEIDLMPMMLKRLTLTGSTLRPRTLAFKAHLARELERHVWPLLADNRVKVIVDKTFPLNDAAAAHRHMESSAHMGKIALDLS